MRKQTFCVVAFFALSRPCESKRSWNLAKKQVAQNAGIPHSPINSLIRNRLPTPTPRMPQGHSNDTDWSNWPLQPPLHVRQGNWQKAKIRQSSSCRGLCAREQPTIMSLSQWCLSKKKKKSKKIIWGSVKATLACSTERTPCVRPTVGSAAVQESATSFGDVTLNSRPARWWWWNVHVAALTRTTRISRSGRGRVGFSCRLFDRKSRAKRMKESFCVSKLRKLKKDVIFSCDCPPMAGQWSCIHHPR